MISDIVTRWIAEFQIDISEEFDSSDIICEYECLDTGLKFYLPSRFAGSSALYEGLSRFPWYYEVEKWEYDIISEIVSDCASIFEVGCGLGHFLKMCRAVGLNSRGCEINEEAVEYACSAGIDVEYGYLDSVSEKYFSAFDCVVAFQVLEHVPDPLSFLKSCLNLLRPHGRLILSVPNDKGLISWDDNLLNMPPHHMSKWSLHVFRQLSSYLDVDLIRHWQEPLAIRHKNWFLSVLVRRYPLLKRFRCLTYLVDFLLRSGILGRFKGHSLLVVFEKRH